MHNIIFYINFAFLPLQYNIINSYLLLLYKTVDALDFFFFFGWKFKNFLKRNYLKQNYNLSLNSEFNIYYKPPNKKPHLSTFMDFFYTRAILLSCSVWGKKEIIVCESTSS